MDVHRGTVDHKRIRTLNPSANKLVAQVLFGNKLA
jgi:hypothetical protein